MVSGIGASAGIAIGSAFALQSREWNPPEKLVDVAELAYEYDKLTESIRISKQELTALKNDIAELIGEPESNIFNAHLAILEDPIFMNEVRSLIELQHRTAESAVKETIDKFIGMFELLDDEYMKERAADIKDVGNRLLKHLLGGSDEIRLPADNSYILVAKELTPSQMAHLDTARILGIVTMLGGTTSHAAIMAKALGIPFVLGLEGKLDRPIVTNDFIIMDGDEGSIFVNPEPDIIGVYQERKATQMAYRDRLRTIVSVPAETADGKRLVLHANISSLKELDEALLSGASGVGLFRTEFIYMDRTSLPKESEQFDVYRKAAEKLEGKPIIIRLLDIGGDKNVDYIQLPKEENPAMGYRAIRVLLSRSDLFLTQIRAILRASHYGNVKIMFPMISSVEEVRAAKELLETAKSELAAEGIPFNRRIEVGIMIEVPAAVAISDLLAQEVDFFSIGTNDLIQYALATDRMNESIAHLYDPYHPAILRLLQKTIESANSCGIPVSVCGELAGDKLALPIWLGLGIREISMSVQSILPVKERLLRITEASSARILPHALICPTSAEIRQLLMSCVPDTSVK